MKHIRIQSRKHLLYYLLFGMISLALIFYYLSYTIIHPTTDRQFPINSFVRYPLTILIFPAEIFSFFFALYFVYVLVHERKEPPKPNPLKNKKRISVAVLVPVYNEPKDIVDRTIKATKNLRWPGKVNIYILDDSDNKTDKQNMADIAKKYNVNVIYRSNNEGYKAGNINHAIKNKIKEEYFMVLDSDQAPEKQFLEKTMDYFSKENVGFVQTPQNFINDDSTLERAITSGTNLFYRAQLRSKSKDGAVLFCGTNVVVRTAVFKKAGGFSYYTSTEDLDLGIRMNELGYRGVYVPKVLVNGYAPTSFKSYKSQQYRWANGNLAVLRENWYKLFFGNFPLKYQIHMFFTLGWWLIGIVTLIYVLIPILSLTTGLATHHSWLITPLLFLLFANVIFGIGIIYVSLRNRVEGDKVRFKDAILEYSLITNSLFIYARAAINALLFKRYIGFVRTDKNVSESSYKLISWNLGLAVLCFALSVYALYKGFTSVGFEQFRAYFPLSLWLLFYTLVFASSILFVGKTREAE